MSRDKLKTRERKVRGGRNSSAIADAMAELAPPYEGIGHTLRQAREQAGQDLHELARFLRIRYPYLEAIEEGRFEDLPGRIYAIGFLRTYGEHLGLDSAAVVQAFKAESSAEPRNGKLVFPAPAPETRMPGARLVVVALLVAAAAYGGWLYLQRQDRARLAEIPPPPVEATGTTAPQTAAAPAIAPPASLPPAPDTTQGSSAETTPSDGAATPPPPETASGEMTPATVGAGPKPADAPDVSPESPAAAPEAAPTAAAPKVASTGAASTEAASTAAASTVAPVTTAPAPPAPGEAAPPEPPGAAATGQVYGDTEHPVRVVLIAHADAWIDVRDADNKIIFPGRVLRPGDSYRVPNQSRAVLWTGNLGALEFVVDGKPLPTQGSYGEARRNISLDPQRLLAGAAKAQ